MKSLSNKEDVSKSFEASSDNSKSNDFIKLDKAINYVAIKDANYSDGFFHFKKGSIACKGGIAGNGFAPDVCPICDQMMAYYDDAKALTNDGDTVRGEVIRKKGNDLRAGYQMYLSAIKADAVLVKDKQTQEKSYEPDFDDVKEFQVWALTEHQKKLLLQLIDDPKYPTIKSGADLVGLVLHIERATDGNKKTLSITPVGTIDFNTLGIDQTKNPDLERYAKIPSDDDYIKFLNGNTSDSSNNSTVEDDVEEVDLAKSDVSSHEQPLEDSTPPFEDPKKSAPDQVDAELVKDSAVRVTPMSGAGKDTGGVTKVNSPATVNKVASVRRGRR